MKYYAVIDTNVLVSALLRWDSVPGAVLERVLVGNIIPLLNEDIMKEYEEVLKREKFSFLQEDVRAVLNGILKRGVILETDIVVKDLPDADDSVFYAVTMEARKDKEAYLVTGNIKHFPIKMFVVTPREMLTIAEQSGTLGQSGKKDG